MASVTVTIPNTNWSLVTVSGLRRIRWLAPINQRISIGRTLSADGNTEMFLTQLIFPYASSGSQLVFLQFAANQSATGSDPGPEFSSQMETSGTIRLTRSDGTSLELTGTGETQLSHINGFHPI